MANPEVKSRLSVVVRTSELTTANKLLGRKVLEPNNRSINEPPTNIGGMPILVIEERVNGRSVYTAAVKTRLSGKRLNQIHWETAARGNSFGLDRDDFISDHTRMLYKDPTYASSRGKHEETGKPWKIYRRYGPRQLEAFQNKEKRIGEKVIPVIRWTAKQDSEGETVREFVYSPFMHSDEGKVRLKEFLGRLPSKDMFENICDPSLGLSVLAIFSPEQKGEWPSNSKLPSSHSRNIGTTQAPLYVLMQAETLLESDFLPAAEAAVQKAA
ncbi:MAG: hypothetical protein A2776_03050 [Candidatus Levybacteria bacterium RIFCSPHIGHO2_01_FULL_40_10]|nr:MAG: hypothetical protein A2776_03050 [Candidatus Levybacteria bacterium RIFCSPHIGHO2_01_FULL_40_10]